MMNWRNALLAGLGALLAIGLLALMGRSGAATWLMAPFGASCVLLFSLPDSPLAQPRNVIGGHLLTAAIGVAIQALPLPIELRLALATGLAIAAMHGLNLIHPPAGANPLLVILTQQPLAFLWQTVLPGAVSLVVLALAYRLLRHRAGASAH